VDGFTVFKRDDPQEFIELRHKYPFRIRPSSWTSRRMGWDNAVWHHSSFR